MRSRTLRSAHVGVAVVLAAPAPAQAISNGHADGEEHPRVSMLVADLDPDHAGVEAGLLDAARLAHRARHG